MPKPMPKPTPKHRLRPLYVAVLAVAAASALGGASRPAQAAGKTVITCAYSETYVFDNEDLTKKWWGGIKAEFEKEHPDVTVQLEPIQGGYDDILNKLSLLYRSPATAPDIAQMATPMVDRVASAGYLLPLDKFLATTAWWKRFPPVIQQEAMWQGKTYGVTTGENDFMLYYDVTLFKKAGLPVPWKPMSWNDILAAGRVVKAKLPGVVPIWILAGSGAGDFSVLMGVNMLLPGSSTPTIFDDKTQKWVVDSPGLREVFGFFHSVFSEGMGGKLSDLFSESSNNDPIFMMPKHQIAIAFGGNWYGGNWSKLVSTPYWPEAAKVAAAVAVPTVNGKAPNISTMISGWDRAVSATTKTPALTLQLLDLMESKENQINAANWAGFVPGDTDYVKDPEFINFAAPYNELSAVILPFGITEPASGDYLVWSRGVQEATAALAQHPNTSVDQTIKILSDYVGNQLDPSQTEVLK
jgi:multiple sugar transport system substrate-binding protein